MTKFIPPRIERTYEARRERNQRPPDPATLGPVARVWRYRPLPYALARMVRAVLGVAAFLVVTVSAKLGRLPDLHLASVVVPFAVIVGVAVVPLWWAGWRCELRLHRDGLSFAYLDAIGTLPWTEVTSLVATGRGGAQLTSGRWRITLGPLHTAVVTAARASVSPIQWAQMIAAFDRGEPFSFGPVSATPDGLRSETTAWSWGEIAAVDWSGAQLVITTRGARPFAGSTTTIPAQAITFVDVLRQLVRDRMGDRSAAVRRSFASRAD